MNNVNDILNIFNDHGFTDTSLATKIAFLNDTISDFCSREPWPFLETTVTLTFDGTNSVPSNMPDDFRASKVIVDVATGRPIQPDRVENLEKSRLDVMTSTGDPLYYYFVGSELRFAPIPASTFTARATYVRFHPVVTSSSVAADFVIPKRAWMVLVFGTLSKLYDMEDDPELSLRFEQHYETRIQQVRAELWQRNLDRPDHIVMTDPDDWNYDD